jgi:hypothetical protein
MFHGLVAKVELEFSVLDCEGGVERTSPEIVANLEGFAEILTVFPKHATKQQCDQEGHIRQFRNQWPALEIQKVGADQILT